MFLFERHETTDRGSEGYCERGASGLSPGDSPDLSELLVWNYRVSHFEWELTGGYLAVNFFSLGHTFLFCVIQDV